MSTLAFGMLSFSLNGLVSSVESPRHRRKPTVLGYKRFRQPAQHRPFTAVPL